jgi:type IV pilus assembly protein PilY1
MLWFGTGRWFAVDDRIDTTVQSMYGVLDKFGNQTITRSDLVGQTINTTGASAGRVTGSAVSYTGGNSDDGWFLDLPRTGERMVTLPLIQNGRLLFSTLIPSDNKCEGDTVAGGVSGGTSSILAIDPYQGRGLATQIFVNRPGLDFIASTVGVIRNLVYIGAGTKAYLYAGGATATGAAGTIQFEELRPIQEANPRGRVSWREIVK